MKPWPLSVLVVLIGCSFDSATVATIDNSCAGNASCSQGVCDGDICIDDSGASVVLAIEVVRGAGGNPSRHTGELGVCCRISIGLDRPRPPLAGDSAGRRNRSLERLTGACDASLRSPDG